MNNLSQPKLAVIYMTVIFIIFGSASCATKDPYNLVKQRDSIQAYSEFISKYPDHPNRSLAQERLKELKTYRQQYEEVELFKQAEAIEDYENYLTKYPQGQFTNEARQNIEELRAESERRAELVKIGTDLGMLEQFVRKYPIGREGSAAMKARARIEDIYVKDILSNGPNERLIVPYIVASSCPPGLRVCTGTLTLGNGPSGFDALEFELPGDSAPVAGLGPLPLNKWGHGSIIRFKGKHEIDGITFLGSETDSLAFMLFLEKGMVYLHGSGEVIYKDGNRIVLPSLEKGEADK